MRLRTDPARQRVVFCVGVVATALTVAGSGCGSSSSDATTSGSGAAGASASTSSAPSSGPTGATTSGSPTGTGTSATSGTASSGTGGQGGAKPSPGCGVTGKPTGDLHLMAMDGQGTQRDYEVLIPASYDPSKPLALALVYHGAGGNESTAKGFGLQNAQGAGASAIFVFPKGIPFQTYGIGWDDSCGGYDMPFFDAMVSNIESSYCVDEHRLFVAGFSWGGDQTTALLCCRGDRIRAAAPSSCTDEFANASDYKTYQSCPVTNGAAIRFTHDANGDSAYPNPLFATTSALYRSWNTCGPTGSPIAPSPCMGFAGCAAPFIECPYQGLGHALPSSWAADTWTFFSTFD